MMLERAEKRNAEPTDIVNGNFPIPHIHYDPNKEGQNFDKVVMSLADFVNGFWWPQVRRKRFAAPQNAVAPQAKSH